MRADRGDRLAVLTYHRIGDPAQAPPGMVSATPAAFQRQMRRLGASGRAVSLADVLAARAGASQLPPHAVLVTFDDAYADFAEHAWPVLRSYGIPVTLFVPTAFPGDGGAGFWWDRLHAAVAAAREPLITPLGRLPLEGPGARRQAYRTLREHVKTLPHDEGMALVNELVAKLRGPPPNARVLSWEELRNLAAGGVTLAPHTRTHPCLDRLPTERLADEIAGSVAELEAEIGAAAPAFAYPAGRISPAAEEAVRASGIELAFTTAPGIAALGNGSCLALPRLAVGRRGAPWLLRGALAAPVVTARLAAARESPRRRPRDPPHADADADAMRPAVAYVMSRFPKLSETFILTEILALDQRRVRVEVYPLLRERSAVAHEEAAAVARRAHYLPFISPAVLASQLHWLRRRPRTYLATLKEIAVGTSGSLNFFVGGLAIFPKVAHAARLMEADGVVHVHCHFANHPALAGFTISRLTGIPYSFTAHGSDLHVDRRMLPEKVAAAAFVATISGYNRRLIVDECGGRFAEKVHVIRAGIDTTHFAPQRRPGRADALRLLCVGTLHEVKGQAHLIEACRLLTEQGCEIECRLVGDGPDRPMLRRRIAAAGLAQRVLLVGARTRSQVAEELADADVLVAPSVPTAAGKREGIPVVLMEAMSAGVAVVASNLSGIPELVEDGVTGLLVAPGDAVDLARALSALHADPELRRRLGEQGRRRVLEEFDIERSASELVGRFSIEPAR